LGSPLLCSLPWGLVAPCGGWTSRCSWCPSCHPS